MVAYIPHTQRSHAQSGRPSMEGGGDRPGHVPCVAPRGRSPVPLKLWQGAFRDDAERLRAAAEYLVGVPFQIEVA